MCAGKMLILSFTIVLDLVDCTLKLFIKCFVLLWYIRTSYTFLCFEIAGLWTLHYRSVMYHFISVNIKGRALNDYHTIKWFTVKRNKIKLKMFLPLLWFNCSEKTCPNRFDLHNMLCRVNTSIISTFVTATNVGGLIIYLFSRKWTLTIKLASE